MLHARFLRASVVLVTITSWIVLACGCPGTLTDEEKQMFQGGGSCPDIPSLLSAKCGNYGCHPQGAVLDLTSAGVASRLVGKNGTNTCSSYTLANPSDPSGSLLYKKFSDSPPCGSKMPLGSSLSALEIKCIEDWIGSLDPNAGTGGGGGATGAGGAGGAP